MLNVRTMHCHTRNRGDWQKKEYVNTIMKTGLQEIAAPYWPPTYKMADLVTMQEVQLTNPLCAKCLRNDLGCFANRDGTYEDDPAWTDRVLTWTDTNTWSWRALNYTRRPG